MSDMQYQVPPEEEEAGFASISMKKDCGVADCDLLGIYHKHTHWDGSLKTLDEIKEEVRETNARKAQCDAEQKLDVQEERKWLQTAYLQPDETIQLWREYPFMEITKPGDKLYAIVQQEHKHLAVGKRSTLFRYPDGHVEEVVEDLSP
jgi:hypothetical protein